MHPATLHPCLMQAEQSLCPGSFICGLYLIMWQSGILPPYCRRCGRTGYTSQAQLGASYHFGEEGKKPPILPVFDEMGTDV